MPETLQLGRALAIALLGTACPGAIIAQDTPTAYEDVYADFIGLAPLATRVATIDQLTLSRDAGSLTLHSGQLALLSPVAGRTVAAVFTGSASFSLTPPNEVEQREVHRFLGTTGVQQHVSSLFLLFTDSTLKELEQQVTFAPGPLPAGASSSVEAALDQLVAREEQVILSDAAAHLLNEDEHGFFLAFMFDGDEPLVYFVDPLAYEDISVYQLVDEEAYLITQFPAKDPSSLPKSLVNVADYIIDATIDDDLMLEATATLHLRYSRPGARWIPFFLHDSLVVSSVTASDNTVLPHFQGAGSPIVWVDLGTPISPRGFRDVTLAYRGNVIANLGTIYYNIAATEWYPRHDPASRATFQMTFRTPEHLTLAAVGDLLTRAETDHANISTWMSSAPIRNATFALGDYDIYDLDVPNVGRASVMSMKRVVGQRAAADARRAISADVLNSVRFYRDVYGDLLHEHFVVAEIPTGHGEAFPGMIQLSWETFLTDQELVSNKLFRAHEIAHQWWGIGVNYDNPRDRWLSEGLSEFSSLWFLEDMLNDPVAAEAVARSWADELHDAQFETGPIAVGDRATQSFDSDEDSQLITYYKGAMVFRALRNVMRDEDDGDDELFADFMRDLYQSHRGKTVTTADVQRLAEQHSGQGLNWFFEQWVRGTRIPEYRVSYSVERQADSAYTVVARVEQWGMPMGFHVRVPYEVWFAEAQPQGGFILIDGPLTTITLPATAARPTRFVVNPHMDVLARVEEVPWADVLRVATRSGAVTEGRLLNASNETLTMEIGQTATTPRRVALSTDSIASISYPAPVDHRVKGTVFGALAGGLTGLLVNRGRPGRFECRQARFGIRGRGALDMEVCVGRGTTSTSYGITAVAVAAGGVIGYLLGKTWKGTRWETIQISTTASSIGIGGTLSFSLATNR